MWELRVNKSSTILSGILAVAVYCLLLFALLFYFNSRERVKPIHYVKKNEDKIRVSLASEVIKEKPSLVIPPILPPKVQKKERVKKKKDIRKKVIKEKIVKKVKPKKKPKPKVNPKEKPKKVNKPKSSKDLFKNISTPKKPKVKPKEKPKKQEKPKPQKMKPIIIPKRDTRSASQMLSESLKDKKRSDSGAENAFLSGAEQKLQEGWMSQSGFLNGIGKATVEIKIFSNGEFNFKILKYASNSTFNELLIAYLKQYQKIGLGRHKKNRAFTIKVYFEAKE
ncbi:TolA protein [hydrothermal vent metagenome]|uniref:TolA protein n=1 Tax=hydrothermal vent metagenome TaxID=652676 RepID=A0A1W1CZ44_9ZZZZ